MMKKSLILNILLFVTLTISAQTSKNFIDQPYIEVSGKAELEIVPDMIYLKVVIDEKDSKTKATLEQQEQKMMKALAGIGVDTKKDVAVIDYTSKFQEHWIKRTNINTSKQYEILVHSGKMVAEIFIELEKIDISNISVTKLDHTKIEEYRKEVKILAIRAAKSKAEILMEAIGQKAGKALYIQEISRNIYQPRTMASNTIMKLSSAASDQYIPDVEFQKLNLEAEIQARFVIE
ncbi:SIMPL domain-containing protein [Carboxylicivirga caseinilyticus]|uniref:SIMPL domain-containing protein n=1 Tax=Carboxylicivirga caseinilyticus TaxID=3417572 RepID=UPI003D32DB17|nr:SIMPL domain-containing protein [Marinilabiliaceae bacterium A049]